MRSLCLLFLVSAPVWAQQLVIPDELSEKQKAVYRKVTESVSAPCCSNAIPVAYHESGMALHVKEVVLQALLNGDSEKKIMADLGKMELGPNKSALIFAVPDRNLLGWLIWFTPLIAMIFGLLFIYVGRDASKSGPRLSNEELVDTYRDYIKTQVASRSEAK